MNEVGLDNWKITSLLTLVCNQKTIFEFERAWVKATCADLNMISPVREEETRQEYDANYYKNNKEAIQKRKTEWYKINKGMVQQRQAE